ncbi:tyrosine-type recombinase/integrase [Natronosporangium hydrolyticum]|uniref:Tyrosine-type recombinase/integrase n=1 Tax=Natronosporangium hydrolyticum TaxID=2811111 RepID=A0A895YR90_9ACTN|nr:tyrosine-type recombinase/integrase [Natronosporangium hydrolyticum]
MAALTAAWLADYAVHTQRAYFRDLADFLAWCQRERLDPRTVRPVDVGRYRVELAQPATGPAPTAASVHRRLAALSSWYQYLVANSDGEVVTNPVSGVRRPKVDRDASTTVGLSTEEVRDLLRAADRNAQEAADQSPRRRLAALRDRALLRLLADLGLRVGEALALELTALSYNRGRRTLRYFGKGGKQRERPLSPHVLEALDEYLAARAERGKCRPDELTGPLFATSGRDGTVGRLDEPAAFRLIRRLAVAAALPSARRLSPHSLRHAFATNARELGVPLEDVQDAMGHADTRTTRRYDRARHALHRDPALKLGDLYADRDDPHPPG